jgi:chemotaxis protein CheD
MDTWEMDTQEIEIPSYNLNPGEAYVGSGPAVITTILGSCVSVTMRHAKSGISAMCHGVLPSCEKGKCSAKSCPERFKFVECSIRRMLDKFDACGVNRSGIEVKIFGGSDMFGETGETTRKTVGKQNISVAQGLLESEGLRICSFDTGGTQGRKIVFYTHTGDVFLKRIGKN